MHGWVWMEKDTVSADLIEVLYFATSIRDSFLAMQLKCLGVNPVQHTATVCHDEIFFIGRETPTILEWRIPNIDLKPRAGKSNTLPD